MKDNPHILKLRNRLVNDGVDPDKALNIARTQWVLNDLRQKFKAAKQRRAAKRQANNSD